MSTPQVPAQPVPVRLMRGEMGNIVAAQRADGAFVRFSKEGIGWCRRLLPTKLYPYVWEALAPQLQLVITPDLQVDEAPETEPGWSLDELREVLSWVLDNTHLAGIQQRNLTTSLLRRAERQNTLTPELVIQVTAHLDQVLGEVRASGLAGAEEYPDELFQEAKRVLDFVLPQPA